MLAYNSVVDLLTPSTAYITQGQKSWSGSLVNYPKLVVDLRTHALLLHVAEQQSLLHSLDRHLLSPLSSQKHTPSPIMTRFQRTPADGGGVTHQDKTTAWLVASAVPSFARHLFQVHRRCQQHQRCASATAYVSPRTPSNTHP